MNEDIKVVVADTNIWIDFATGNILDRLFQLPYDFSVPEIVFHSEIKYYDWSELVLDNAIIEKLNSEEVTLATQYKSIDTQRDGKEPNFNDCTCLSLAKSRDWTLATNDVRLRRIAEGILQNVKNTEWIFNELLAYEIIDAETANTALKVMKEEGRKKLPFDKIRRLIKLYK